MVLLNPPNSHFDQKFNWIIWTCSQASCWSRSLPSQRLFPRQTLNISDLDDAAPPGSVPWSPGNVNFKPELIPLPIEQVNHLSGRRRYNTSTDHPTSVELARPSSIPNPTLRLLKRSVLTKAASPSWPPISSSGLKLRWTVRCSGVPSRAASAERYWTQALLLYVYCLSVPLCWLLPTHPSCVIDQRT